MMNSEVLKVVKKTKKPTLEKKATPRPANFSLSDKVAGDSFHYKNYFIAKLKETFFDNPNLWNVDKYYPYGDNAPIFIDEPKSIQDLELCNLKKVVMAKNNFRYLVIDSTMDLVDCLKEVNS